LKRDGEKIVEVAAGLVFRGGKLLITQRRPGDHLGGLWEFPGGKREKNESFHACLERELMEELGILVQVRELVGRVTHRYPEHTVRLRFYRCEWLKHEPRAVACHALAWIKRDQLSRYSFPPADARLLRRLEAFPELWG
jgi:mutator protein MutT